MHIIKRGETYRVTISLGTDSNGKRIRETLTLGPYPNMTAKQAYQTAYKEAIEKENEAKHGHSNKYEKMTFAQFAEEEYFEKRASQLKEYTAVQYRDIYEKRLKPFFGKKRIRYIRAIDIIEWLNDMERSAKSNSKDKALSDNSKGVYFRTLSAMLGFAVRADILDDNPCRRVVTPKSKQTAVKALQKSDFEKLFANIDNYKEPEKGSKEPSRSQSKAVLLIYLISLTGVREGEACGLKWQDIDFENKIIHIEREVMYLPGKKEAQVTPPKSATSTRDIFIPEILCEKLKAYKAIQEKEISERGDKYQNDGYIITQFDGSPVHASTVRKWIKQACEFCGVPYITVHGLRHTYASLMISSGVDPRTTASQLGHSTPSLTMNIYANPQNEAKRRAGDLMGNLLKEAKRD